MPKALPRKGLGQDDTGLVTLPAYRAQYENLQGPGAQYNEKLDCVGSWDSETARVYWTFEITKPGSFNLVADYSSSEDSEIKVSLNGETKTIKIQKSGDNMKRFKKIEFGNFKISKAGKYEFSLIPVTGKWNGINLKEIKVQLKK